MKTIGKNERIKHAYFRYLKEARRYSEPSIDAAAKAIARFETYNRQKDFAAFRIEQATGFKADLDKQRNVATGKSLSVATKNQTLNALRTFFLWLADQQGYRRRIRYSDADYFNPSLKDAALAKSSRDSEGPTLEQVRLVLANMPTNTDIERRNRALIAFALLTGARDDAIASLRMKHVDISRNELVQDPKEVRTKASKPMVTSFFPVGDDIRSIVVEWVEFLRVERHWGRDDPLFSPTRIGPDPSGSFEAIGLKRECWSTATPIRRIFREAFEAAGLPYFNPHSIRKTLARLGETLCTTPEDFKAWSQNLGHNQVLTTFLSYGEVDRLRQREILQRLGQPKLARADETAAALLAHALELAHANGGQPTRLRSPS